MDELPRLLELLHLAGRRWTTVHAHVRIWCHGPRAVEAAAARGETVDRRRRASVAERVDHVWYEDVDRWRCEIEETAFLHIQNGRRSFRRDPREPRFSGSFDDVGWGDADSRSHRFLWDPNVLIPQLWFERLDEERVRDREVIRVSARPRETTHDFIVLPSWADGFELVVDAERGVLLRLASRFRGEDVLTADILQVAFDESFEPGTLSIPDS